MAYFVKFYILVSGFGNTGPAIYIVASENIKGNEIDVHMVPGFGIGTLLDACSYIVFCKTRSASMKFYIWFFMDIFVPYVIKSRYIFVLDLCIPAYICLDGGSDQINSMKEEEVIAACTTHNIIIRKSLYKRVRFSPVQKMQIGQSRVLSLGKNLQMMVFYQKSPLKIMII